MHFFYVKYFGFRIFGCEFLIKCPMGVYRVLLLFALLFSLNSCKIGRFVYYNFADITDHKIFPSRLVENDSTVFHFPQAEEQKKPKKITIDGAEFNFDDYLKENKTVAFLIIQNDSIQYENYWYNYDQASVVASFSMAKSVMSILIGCAIDDGLISSVEDRVTDFIPELKQNGFEDVTIEHLLQMTSGLKFNEGYFNPFGEVATFYYGTNLRKSIEKLKLKRAPGLEFEYVSGNTQILGLILERALKGPSISSYLQEKLWQPLGMEYDATWSIDRKKEGLEKTFCCLNARARDFAKIGRLYLNKGNWNGRQIVSEEWVARSTQVDTADGSSAKYQYQWWLPTENGDFMAKGILGQYIYVNPNRNLILVRLGKKKGEADWDKLLPKIAATF